MTKKASDKKRGRGRPPIKNGRSVPRAIKVSQEVSDYLYHTGTGIIEDMIRESNEFKQWAKESK
jgi:hypothetical protein